MPQWIHDRARHIQAKNPSMPESQAFAIATQQSHAVGKSPKGYGTSGGRKKAKEKYKTPGDDKKTADPGGIGKQAQVVLLAPFVGSFVDEITKIAQVLPAPAGMSDSDNRAQIGTIKSTSPKDTSKPGGVPRYSKVNSGTSLSPIAQHQPVLAAPPVRT
jgi:hypothetical protein